jgi:hypothetical protein
MMGLGLSVRAITVSTPLLLALLHFLSASALAANDIKGHVQNRTRSQAAVGDAVILLRLDQGMLEEARTVTGAQGAFLLTVQFPGKPYLVRVIHQGVNYDQQASPRATLSIDVFDAARKVPNVTANIEIIRAGTHGESLHVSDLYEIKNQSSPPLTQAGERTLEVFLPPESKIDSVLAAGPAKITESISAVPVPADPGHYTVNFPLRPGATKFAFNYDLPYHGRAAFPTRHVFLLRQLAVMIPLGMKFSSPYPAFGILATGNARYQVHAASQLKPGEGPGFEITGSGSLPPLVSPAGSRAKPSPVPPNGRVAAAGQVVSLVEHKNSRLEQARPTSQSLALSALTAILLAGCALLVMRRRKTQGFPRGENA